MPSTTNSTTPSLTGSITGLNLDPAAVYYKTSAFPEPLLNSGAPADPLSTAALGDAPTSFTATATSTDPAALPAATNPGNSRKSVAAGLDPALAATPASAPTGATASVPTASLQSNGQGAGKKATDPPPPAPQPEVLLRGPNPWDASRVADLIRSGKVQASWLPDIRATALTHLQIQNVQQREMLRFSNSIANTGSGPWQVRRGTPLTDPGQIAYAVSLGLDPGQLAITGQELLDANGAMTVVIPDAALSEFHPAHKHFHIGETAEFGVDRYNASTGSWDRITGLEVVKSTFCLIDVNQISHVAGSDPDHYDIIGSPANEKRYTDCFADVQGVSAGWMDRYNHALPGQEVDVTGLAAGTYRIFTNVNPSGWFLESDYSNNVGFTAFELSRDSNGNAKVREIPGLTGGVWFDHSSNGMG